MRLRFSSRKTSSLSPQVSAAAVSVPSAIERAASFAGCRNTTRTRCRPSSRAIGEVSARARSWPSCDGRSAISVHDDHRAIIGQIHEDAFPAALETEAFRMGRQLDVGELAIAPDIDDRESAATVAHEHTLLDRLDADVVCVLPEL